MNIGYIGLGLMGKSCARNLLKAGHAMFVWARRPNSVADLAAEGMQICAGPAELASKVDMVFTNVTNTPDVEQVLLGPDGVNKGARPGLIAVDMSTISATATRRMAAELAKSGVELVDAPVSGGTAGAAQGTLTIMVGASPETFERIKPVLACMGKSVTRIGDTGSGQVAKSCNQIMITGSIAAVAEAFKFAQANRVDLNPVREALLGGFAGGKILELHGRRMIDKDFKPGFKAQLHLKDMEIVAQVAEELGLIMPVTGLGTDLLRQTVANGHTEEDSSIMAETIDKL